jgi:hypothetical protein
MIRPAASHRRRLSLAGLIVTLSLFVSACAPVAQAPAAPAAAEPTASAEPRVYFVEPVDGATVPRPVKVVMAAENFVIEPASEIVAEGRGHLHIMVDTPCVEAGQGVPKDETHLHYGQGQLEAELELAPGQHTLCLQAADGLHVALPGDGMTQTIAIAVE